MQRIASAFGESFNYLGLVLSYRFTIPTEAVAGDQLAALIVQNVATQVPVPDGWALESSVTDTGRYAYLYTKTAEDDDAGSVVNFYGVSTSVVAGVLVVYRDGTYPMLANGAGLAIVPFEIKWGTAVALLATTTITGIHPEDRRLAVWYIAAGVTITEASGAKITSLGQAIDPVTAHKVTAAEYLAGMSGTTGNMTVSNSGAANMMAAYVTLRARPLIQVESVSDVLPGHVGLVP